MSKSPQQALLAEAARRLGRDELAKRLNVPEPLLETWLNGHAHMPERKFLALLDLMDRISGG